MSSKIKAIYAVEVSGVCNLDQFCTHCPMYARPRNRNRGLMSPEVIVRALHWVERLDKVDALALHNFGEPLLHPEFDKIASHFAKLTPITMSTNGLYLKEEWADRLAKVPWAWISVSPWHPLEADRAARLLRQRGIMVETPPGITHNFAGQAVGPSPKLFQGCDFLNKGKAVIQWDGKIVSCCITDRKSDAICTVWDEVQDYEMKTYDLCKSCHHAV